MLLVSLATANAKCDFSKVTFEKFSQRGNEMYFRTNLDENQCIYYYFTAYDYQLKRVDTLPNWGGRTGVAFNAKGKYQLRLNVVNECEKCDTILTYEVDITIFGKVNVEAKPSSKNCRAYSVSMKDFKDTCMEYYYSVWKADPWMDRLISSQYKNLSDSAIFFGYSYDEKNLIKYNMKSEKSFNIEFKDSGRYFIQASWYNKCTGIDTFMYEKLDVCKQANTTNVKQLVKQDNITVVGYYDLIGRKVDYIEPNKVYIVLYSNGKYAKVVQEL
jgi:hypothetical protein